MSPDEQKLPNKRSENEGMKNILLQTRKLKTISCKTSIKCKHMYYIKRRNSNIDEKLESSRPAKNI